jgi:membrane associated rhomboid family serine protease
MLLVPFRTDRPRLRPAYFTAMLIGVNVLAYAGWAVQSWCLPANASAGAYPEPITAFGLWSSHPSALTFITHLFIHTDPLHLAGNMLFLWIFGSLIEDVIRPWGLAALYLGGGVLAALAHLTLSGAMGFEGNVPLVGASGSVAAIMGLFMIRFFRTRVQLFCWFGWLRKTLWVPAAWALLYWVGLETLGGIIDVATEGGDGISHWAHLGGFAAGAALAPFLGSLKAARNEYVSDDPAANVQVVSQCERIAEAERALKADPDNLPRLHWLAAAYRRSGDDRRAARATRRCLQLHCDRDELDQAVEVYLELLQDGEMPALAPALMLQLGDKLEPARAADAAQLYHELAAKHPTHPAAQHALHRLAALCRERLDQPDEARSCLEELVRRYPASELAALARETLKGVGPQAVGIGEDPNTQV